MFIKLIFSFLNSCAFLKSKGFFEKPSFVQWHKFRTPAFLCVFLVGLSSCKKEETEPEKPVEWNTMVHDFGTISKGRPVSFEFEYTYRGSGRMVVNAATVSCSCMKAETYTCSNGISRGEKCKVKATFDASATGAFSKTVVVETNLSEPMIYLSVKGQVN